MLHATDEIVTEFAIEPYAADAPLHVVAMRTPEAKYATYSHWPEEGIAPLTEGEEAELYDYTNARAAGSSSHNTAGETRSSRPGCAKSCERAFSDELRRAAPEPARRPRTARGFADYFSTARDGRREGGDAAGASRSKARSATSPLGPGRPAAARAPGASDPSGPRDAPRTRR